MTARRPVSEAPVVGVASAPARAGAHYPGAAAYHLYEITRDGDPIRIEARARGMGEVGDAISDLGGLKSLARPPPLASTA